MIEYISDSRLLGAKTLFATHYHELTELEGKIDNVNNYCIAVKKKVMILYFYERLSKAEQIKVTEFKLQNLQVFRSL